MTALEKPHPLQHRANSQRTPVLTGKHPELKRAELADYFVQVFDRYTRLFDTLNCDEAFYQKPITLRHPLIFYFGHTATFFANKLVLAKLLPTRIDPRLESIFAVGVDEMSWDDLDEANYDWPTVAEVRAYRARVRAAVLNLIETLPLSLPIDWASAWWPIIMGIEHELIHLETSTVLIRQHKLAFVQPHCDW